MRSNIEAVIFDIGNVLIRWEPEQFFDTVIGEARRKAMFDQVDLQAMNERLDLGADFKETIYEMADSHPNWRGEIRIWHDRWIEMCQPEIPKSVDLLRQLRSTGVPVFALSNFGVASFKYAQSVYPFLNEFDRYFISGRMGVVKPNPKLYQIVENDCKILPERLLFVDDRLANIHAANSRGWKTHHFSDPQNFEECLISEYLLPKG